MTRYLGAILCVGLIVAAVIGGLLLPGRLVILTGGASFVALGIWQLVSALLVRRGYARAAWGWGNPPEVGAWRGVGIIALGLGNLSRLVLALPWATAMLIAGTLVFFMALILSSRERSKNKES